MATTKLEEADAKLQKEIELARKAQERLLEDLRREAPKGLGGGRAYKDPRKALVSRLVPEAEGPKATKAVYFDHPGEKGERHRRHLAEGWVPVVEQGEHVRQGEDLMYERPREISDALIKDAGRRSTERIKSFEEDLAPAKREGLLTEEKTEVNARR